MGQNYTISLPNLGRNKQLFGSLSKINKMNQRELDTGGGKYFTFAV